MTTDTTMTIDSTGSDRTDSVSPESVGVAGSSRATTESSRRAYERRTRRRQKMTSNRLITPGRPVSSALNRAPFVVVLIVLLATGIAGVLWLNTLTDEAGMRTSTAKSNTTALRLSIEALQRDVAMLDATARIADQAKAMGMVQAGDSAMLMVDGSGAGSVVGEPSAVAPPPPPATPTPTAGAAPTTGTAGQATTTTTAAAAATAPTSPASGPAATVPAQVTTPAERAAQ